MAVTITAAALAEALGLDATEADELAEATRLLSVASAIIIKYAPDAPDAVQNEAVLRFSGYIHGTSETYGAHLKQDFGAIAIEYPTNHGLAFRNSGAAALLSPWKVRHAGKCSP